MFSMACKRSLKACKQVLQHTARLVEGKIYGTDHSNMCGRVVKKKCKKLLRKIQKRNTTAARRDDRGRIANMQRCMCTLMQTLCALFIVGLGFLVDLWLKDDWLAEIMSQVTFGVYHGALRA